MEYIHRDIGWWNLVDERRIRFLPHASNLPLLSPVELIITAPCIQISCALFLGRLWQWLQYYCNHWFIRRHFRGALKRTLQGNIQAFTWEGHSKAKRLHTTPLGNIFETSGPTNAKLLCCIFMAYWFFSALTLVHKIIYLYFNIEMWNRDQIDFSDDLATS